MLESATVVIFTYSMFCPFPFFYPFSFSSGGALDLFRNITALVDAAQRARGDKVIGVVSPEEFWRISEGAPEVSTRENDQALQLH